MRCVAYGKKYLEASLNFQVATYKPTYLLVSISCFIDVMLIRGECWKYNSLSQKHAVWKPIQDPAKIIIRIFVNISDAVHIWQICRDTSRWFNISPNNAISNAVSSDLATLLRCLYWRSTCERKTADNRLMYVQLGSSPTMLKWLPDILTFYRPITSATSLYARRLRPHII